MAVKKYLDSDGVSYLWTKIKSSMAALMVLTGYTKSGNTGSIGATDTLNVALAKLENAIDGKQDSGSYVPTTRTVNSKALSANITLTGADINTTGYSKPTSTSAIATTDSINAALGKLEKALDGKQASGSYAAASHVHGNIQSGGTLATASAVVVTDANSKIVASTSITTTELGYLDGVTSNIQTQLNGKQASGSYAASSHSHGNITNAGAIGTTASLPVITGTNGVLTTGSFGTTAGTFCQGNDSRLSNARTPTSHTHGELTNDGLLGAASVVAVTDADQKLTTSTVTTTELGYLAGVTSAIQTQLDGKQASGSYAASSHTHGNITNAGVVANTAITAGSGDYILLTDSSDSNKVARGIAIGTGTAKFLREDGSWQTVDVSDSKAASTASTGTKLFLVGAAAQSSSGQSTKSNVNCYIGTDNCLYSNGSKVAVAGDLTSLYKVKGSCTYAQLIAKTSVVAGDVWNVTDANGNYPAGTNYVATADSSTASSTIWDALGGSIDLSGYELSSNIQSLSNDDIDTAITASA